MRTFNKLEIVLGSAVTLLLMFFGFYYLQNDLKGIKTLESERGYSQATSQALAIEAEILNLRQLEKNFFLSKGMEQAADFNNAITSVVNHVRSFQRDYQSDAVLEVLYHISEYREAVIDVIELHTSLGLDHEEGIEGTLRQAAHDIESHLVERKNYELLADLMYLRRHEKDFMLRFEAKYIEKFHDRMESLKSKVKTRTDMPSTERNYLSGKLEIYQTNFGLWALDRQLIQEEMAKIDVTFSNLLNGSNVIITSLMEQTYSSAKQSNTARHWSNLSLISVGILSIIAAFLLFRMVIRHRNLTVEIEKIANVDALTELPNRRNFTQHLAQRLEQCHTDKQSLIVGIIDLDGFKSVNDIYGHAAGDQLLQKACKRLRHHLDKKIFLARLGGDEFGLIAPMPATHKDIEKLGNSICDVLRKPFSLNEGIARIAGSVGFAMSSSDTKLSPATLFERADYALYHSKEHSKGELAIFSEEHEKRIRDTRKLEQTLLDADLDSELRVVFQPIVDIKLGESAGMEALARWVSPTLGDVRPDEFIRAAEQTGIVSRLTHILLKKALKEAAQWEDDVFLSFNLSVMDIASPEAALKLMSAIMESTFPPQRLVFEITETTLMLNFNRANEVLSSFRAMGIKIALDDFGTGYSSLGYIQQMPIDRLKIDRAFISDIETNKTTRNIMQSLVNLCDNLDISCIVEGVENHRQLEIVEQMGGRYVQGFYYSRPLEAHKAREFLAESNDGKLNEWQQACA